MNDVRSVAALFDEWAQEDGAIDMSREHWARVEQILEAISVSDGNYLEIGPGNGYSLRYMADTRFSNGQCYGVDVSEGMIECARQEVRGLDNVHLIKTDFLTWQPPDDIKFDLIFSMEVLYYFEDLAASIHKAASLLSPGGELIVMLDYFKENSDSHSWPDDLCLPLVLWSKADYATSFSAAGLSEVTQTVITGGHLEPGITLCTRGKRAC